MKLAVYLASSSGSNPAFGHDAAELGTWMAANDIELIYGGASVGTMGILADAVLKGNGKVTGVMPRFMINGHKEHHSLQQLIVTSDMSERKKKMMELADHYAALPGGPGTLEEVSEVISSLRLHLIRGKCFLLNTNGFYEPLKKQLQAMLQNGFVKPEEIADVVFVDNVNALEGELKACLR